jgi:hypothetical protein
MASPAALFSQSTTLHQNLYWLRYHNQFFFTKRLSWINEIDNRRFFSPNIENQFIAHSHVQYKIRQLTLGTGCSFSWQYTQDPEKQSVTVPEIRPFQEILVLQKVGKHLSLQHSLRVDERFIRNHTTTELLPGYDFLFRFRYRAQLSYLLKENTNKNTSITVRLSESIFLNDRYNTFDQSRFYVGVIFQLNKNLLLEPGYMYVYQHRLNNDVYLSRPTFRFTLYHRLFLKGAR